ncbi:hypothetical protein MYCTH_2305389 [Thermothelomyces thermophilus ATCC 42464]|uniref:Protein kinase domain-containing protein n=1 Tax=Thermothelomyces thermophilus (strain ATCC 42464 / BCRC 31852 / DSM 1799) TaxID=573729 RepID=G2QCS2_THET4|nr:uncharacterized protein MYCTH_2305389 [Thermothelomyces thermophilus ATCC 42464]AEO58194.1 hypothetical protein MYCTH_2305389 [Thermothelomyces thermophilus ATCC 42464]
MASVASLPNPPKPLPQVPGPKLAPFTATAHADIEFIEELGNPDSDVDSRVWKVKINGLDPYYVLKMFPFALPRYLGSTTGRYLTRRLSSPLHYIDFLDPFNCECRVYGRLKQEGREDLAVRAYGYLLLTPQQEAEVAEVASGTDILPHVPANTETVLDGCNFWGRWEVHRHLPVRAIVKELVTDYTPFVPSRLHDHWRDLEDLHKLGILVRDIGPRNYMASGKLIDFSRSWTMPSPCFEAIDRVELLRQRHNDALNLHVSIVHFGMGERWDWGDPGYDGPTTLEAHYGVPDGDPLGYYGIDPTAYDWRRWEDDPKAADAFLKYELYAAPESQDDEGVQKDNLPKAGGAGGEEIAGVVDC